MSLTTFDLSVLIFREDIETHCLLGLIVSGDDCSRQQQRVAFMTIHEVEIPPGMLLRGKSVGFPDTFLCSVPTRDHSWFLG